MYQSKLPSGLTFGSTWPHGTAYGTKLITYHLKYLRIAILPSNLY